MLLAVSTDMWYIWRMSRALHLFLKAVDTWGSEYNLSVLVH